MADEANFHLFSSRTPENWKLRENSRQSAYSIRVNRVLLNIVVNLSNRSKSFSLRFPLEVAPPRRREGSRKSAAIQETDAQRRLWIKQRIGQVKRPEVKDRVASDPPEWRAGVFPVSGSGFRDSVAPPSNPPPAALSTWLRAERKAAFCRR